jgi:hypothetical protein
MAGWRDGEEDLRRDAVALKLPSVRLERSAAVDDSKPSTPTTMRGTAFMRSSW